MEDKLNVYKFSLPGAELQIADYQTSAAPGYVYEDILKRPEVFTELKDPKVIVDVGAHVGILSCYLAKLYPKATIHSIEPFNPNFYNLKLNIEMNKITNIIPHHLGLSGDGLQLRINTPANNTGAACHVFGWNENASFTDTKLLTQFLNEQKIEIVDFLKMDVESSEYTILENFNEWNRIKDMYIELHGLFPHPQVTWRGLVSEWKKKLLSVPILGKMTVVCPGDFVDK